MRWQLDQVLVLGVRKMVEQVGQAFMVQVMMCSRHPLIDRAHVIAEQLVELCRGAVVASEKTLRLKTDLKTGLFRKS